MIVRIWKLIIRECGLFMSNHIVVTIALLVPVLYTLMFSLTYLPDRVSHIPTQIIDYDNSAVSRELIQAFKRHDYVGLVKVGGTVEEFKRESILGNRYLCVVIPKDFELNLKKNRQVKLLGYIEASNMIIANTLVKAVSEVAATFSAGVEMKKLNMRGTPASYAMGSAMPIASQTRLLNNPALNYKNFLLPGLVATIVQQVTLLIVALGFSKELEEKRLKEVLELSAGPFELITAKTIFYSILSFTTCGFGFVILFNLFHVTFIGSSLLFSLLTLFFILSLVALGLMISMLVRTQMLSIEILMVIAVPSFIVSGYTWPKMSMIAPIAIINWLLPLTHYLEPVRQISAMNASFDLIRDNLIWLWGLVIVSYVVLYPLVAWELNKVKKSN